MASDHRRFKDAVYVQLGRVGRAVSAPKRLELLDLLCQAPRTVEALAKQAELSMANASQHLRILREAGLVASEKRGQFVAYRLADPEVEMLLLRLRALAEQRLPEVERLTRQRFGETQGQAAEDRERLIGRMQRGEVTVLDVRPAEEYHAAHVPGALSIPVEQLADRLGDLPRDRDVVAYCRGPYCAMAVEAVACLRAAGFTAHRLDLGVTELQERRARCRASSANTNTVEAP